MKVLFVANEAQIGGATKSLIYLADYLRQKYDVEPFIIMSRKGLLTELCEKHNITYRILNYKPFFVPDASTTIKKVIKRTLYPFYKWQHYFCNKVALKKIDTLLDMSKIDIIHTNVNRDDFGILLSQKYHKPHIQHIREFQDQDYKGIYLIKNHIQFLNQYTDYFIAISDIIKENFIKKGIDKKKIKRIYNGIKIKEDFEKDFSQDKLKILFMGGIQESKGQYQLIEAIHLLPDMIQKQIVVDFYGNGSDAYIHYLEKKIKKYNIIKNFNFKGYNKNIENIISKYDIGIMCSKAEAFGRVTVEYMSNKLLTIASNTGANLEIIQKDTGFLYKYNNNQELANVIEKIFYMDTKKRKEIIQNGYERAKVFSVEKNAEEIIKLYKKVM